MSPSSRKQLQAAFFLYAAFLLYATLWPFDFHFDLDFLFTRKIAWIPFFDPVEGPGRRDALLNIMVFFPFGILSFLFRSVAGKMRRPVLIATLLGGALSLAIEGAQIGLPTRNPSFVDLFMNTMGALLGALSAREIRRKVRSDPDRFRICIRRNAVTLSAIAFALALFASTVRTFDPIMNRRALGIRAWAFVGSPLLPDHLDLDYTVWMVLSFGFLSFLLAEGFTDSSRILRRPFRYAAAFVTSSLYAVLLEAMQILFRSRHPLLVHALLGIIGVSYGIAWHAAAVRFRLAASPLFWIHYTLLVFLAFLSPIPHSIGGFRLDLRGFIPFFFYLRDITLPSLYAAAKAIVLHIPMGIMMLRASVGNLDRTGKIPMVFSAILQATFEIFRGFTGYHSPDPSNILLAGLGAYAGAGLLKSVRMHGERSFRSPNTDAL